MPPLARGGQNCKWSATDGRQNSRRQLRAATAENRHPVKGAAAPQGKGDVPSAAAGGGPEVGRSSGLQQPQ
eukprot:4571467-Alexandrium_andersonii.AAC.1